MGSLTKGMIGKQDLEIQYNTNATETFERIASTGSTLELSKFPDIWTGTGKINVAEIVSDIIYGGTGSGDNLTLYSTSHATKGLIKILDDVFIDPTNEWSERNSILSLTRNVPTPVGVDFNIHSFVQGKGDNATLKGVAGLYLGVSDRDDVTALNKGCLYGLGIGLFPKVDRDNVPFDDVAGIVITNIGTAKATDALVFIHGTDVVGPEWITTIGLEAYSDYGIRVVGNYTLYGLDFVGGTFGVAPIRIYNNTSINARNFLNTDDISLIKLDTSNGIYIGSGAHGIYFNGSNTGINITTFDGTAVGVLSIGNGTAPAAHADNTIQVYSVDSSDATATLGLYTEQAVEAVGAGFTTSHKLKVLVNGTEYWIALDAV